MSSRSRGAFVIFAAVAGGSVLIAANAPSSNSGGKMHSVLLIKPGLWEFGDTAKVAGDTVFPDAVAARIPPAQRAQHLTELLQMISQPGKARECINQATFEQRIFAIETGCTRTMTSNRADRLEVRTECRNESGGFQQSRIARILATNAASVISSFHAVSTRAGKTMTVDSVENGHWISANCGNIHAIPLLQK